MVNLAWVSCVIFSALFFGLGYRVGQISAYNDMGAWLRARVPVLSDEADLIQAVLAEAKRVREAAIPEEVKASALFLMDALYQYTTGDIVIDEHAARLHAFIRGETLGAAAPAQDAQPNPVHTVCPGEDMRECGPGAQQPAIPAPPPNRPHYGDRVEVVSCLTDQHNGQVGEFREWCSRDNTYLVAFGDDDSCWAAEVKKIAAASAEDTAQPTDDLPAEARGCNPQEAWEHHQRTGGPDNREFWTQAAPVSEAE